MSNLSSPEELTDLKRSDLQKLAKQHGIKANLKNDKLRVALSEVLFSSPNTPNTPSTPANSSSKQSGSQRKAKTPKSVMRTPSHKATEVLKVAAKTPNLSSPKPGSSSKPSIKTATPKIVKPVIPRTATPKVHVPTPKASGKKVKRRTQDKEEVSAEKPAKRHRRNTYDKDEPSPHLVASPSGPDSQGKDHGVEEMLSVMTGDMTDDQMKQNLLDALDKRVPSKEVKDGERTKLPRYTGLLQNSQKKPTTPGNKDWDRIHNKHFSKMQSIDEYLAKKQARTDNNLSASMKKIKQIRDKMKSNVDRFKSYQTPPSVKKSAARMKKTVSETTRPKFASPAAKKFVPTVTSVSKASFNFTSKKATSTPATESVKSSKPFVPTVTSVSKANFTFTSRKSASKTATPAPRKSPRLSNAGNENRQSTGLNRTVTLSKTTPFKFRGNNSTLNSSVSGHAFNVSSTQKAKFDLKASLSKPLTWKPHTGTLKPFSANNASTFSGTREVQVKEVNIKSKADRRKAQTKRRADRRLDVQLQRRGLQA